MVAGEAFTQALSEADLLYRFELPLTTPVFSLIGDITEAMKASPSQFVFAPIPSSRAPPYHLSLLGLVNRGSARRDGQVRLLPHAVTEELTIGNLASDRLRYGHEKCVNSNSNTWILNLGGFLISFFFCFRCSFTLLLIPSCYTISFSAYGKWTASLMSLGQVRPDFPSW